MGLSRLVAVDNPEGRGGEVRLRKPPFVKHNASRELTPTAAQALSTKAVPLHVLHSELNGDDSTYPVPSHVGQ
jgi:hypothetical protein